MKLKDNLYKINNRVEEDGVVKYNITLLPESVIYKAHFPGHPITPGVCIAGIVEELLCGCLQGDYYMQGTKNIKFLQVIDPLLNSDITVDLKKITTDEESASVQAVVYSDDVVFTKVSMKCVKHLKA